MSLPLIELVQDDCLKVLPDIPTASVDLISADLPFGITPLKWDRRIDMETIWREFRRLVTPTGVIALHSAQPFTTDLIVAGRDLFKYSLIWQKVKPTGHLHCANRPLSDHEDLLIFSKGVPLTATRTKRRMTYNPQAEAGEKKVMRAVTTRCYGKKTSVRVEETFTPQKNHPRSILRHAAPHKAFHPTQKPDSLLEWIVLSYSNVGDIVLDPTMGAGTAGVAAVRHGRSFFGIEKDPDFFEYAQQRIEAERVPEMMAAE